MTLSDIGGTTLSTAGFDELSANKLWQRLPAVRAGNVSVLSGSTYYGSVYTNMYVARGWDALYSTLQ